MTILILALIAVCALRVRWALRHGIEVRIIRLAGAPVSSRRLTITEAGRERVHSAAFALELLQLSDALRDLHPDDVLQQLVHRVADCLCDGQADEDFINEHRAEIAKTIETLLVLN